MRSRRSDWALTALLAGLSYVPLFTSRPGMVAADTKQYLYLDPVRLTSGAASMWDPNTGLGTVTHQNIGYLFPMGPYYSLVAWLGVPMWVGQRIWMGSLMLGAGLGVAYCARRLGLEGLGRAVAAAAYMLSPYILDYLDRISAILMPWAALGWLIGLTAGAAREGGWRRPAAFAVVVALVGGVNATSILLILAGPALWLAHAVWVSREIRWRRAVAVAGRLALLCTLVSLWWAAGLWAEGRYGINVLRVTETVPTVARTSSAAEILRGLGYWYFYGWDKVQPWTAQSLPYTQSPWLIAVSFAVPGVSIALGLVARWVYRSFCLALIGLGTVVAVGAFPFTHPSLLGHLIENASAGSTVALAMRSVDRIVPLVVMGLALLMGSGLAALRLRWPRAGWAAAVACGGLVAANLPAAWTGGLIAANLSRPSHLPAYWTTAARYLNSVGDGSTVFGLPGEDFAAYSWGVTQDPVAPGLLTRPYLSRQVVPSGSPASANLVQAIDEPIQEGTFDFAALAPLARLMGVGQVLLQSDLQYERYHLPLPQVLWNEMNPPPAGIGPAVTFGGPHPAPVIRYPLDSEARLALPPGTPVPPALAVYAVSDPRAPIRAEPTASPLIVAGDGGGVVEAAGAGLLSSDPTILYAASLSSDRAAFSRAMADGATLVLTDTNPLAQHRWGSLRDNTGQVDQPGVPAKRSDPSAYTLPVFPGQSTADQTVAELSGVKSVSATDYGDSLTFTPENRPVNAVDGNPTTAWTFGAHEPVAGTAIDVDLEGPVTTGHVTVHQVQLGQALKRRITAVTLRFDGHGAARFDLDAASLSAAGQVLSFPVRSFTKLQLTVDAATGGADRRFDGLPAVGFSEISVPGVAPARETLRLPTDLLGQAGVASATHPLVILMQRSRAVEPPRHDPEPTMSRTFDLPTARTFTIGGTAEINAGDSDYLINQLIGLTPPPTITGGGATVVSANSSTRLIGDRAARANAAVDGDPDTSWIAETGPQAGEWLNFGLSRPVTLDHLNMRILNDGRHSLPRRITISTPNASRTVDLPLPPVGTGRPQGSTSTVRVGFPSMTGADLRITIDAVEPVTALDYYSTYAGLRDTLPVGIAELGLPGVVQPAPPDILPAVCTPGLLSVDGHPVDVQVNGTTADAVAGHPVALRPCGNSAAGLRLSAGKHTVVTSPRLPSGWSVDSLDLASAPSTGSRYDSTSAPAPAVRVESKDRTSATVSLTSNGRPFWLVLGQSYSSGWHASLAGGSSLGAPRLVDAFANGWYVPAAPAGTRMVVHLEWRPQRIIWGALVLSGLSLLVCVGVAAWPRRRARTHRPVDGPRLSWRLAAGGPWSWSRALAAATVWGLLVASVSRVWIGVVAAAVTMAVGRWAPGRRWAGAAGALALLALPIYAVWEQVANHYWPSIDWPADLAWGNDLAWLGLALVGSDLVVSWLRARGPGCRPSPAAAYPEAGMEPSP